MSNNNEIPVLFTPDENFMLQTCVAILSMQKNKNADTEYHFYLLVSSEINRDCFKYLEYLKVIDSQINYTITYFDTKEIDKQKIFTPHITSSTYYRLYAADLYDFERCIYNDGDIIVNDDLREMYDVELGDSYVAGVKSIVQQQGEQRDVDMIEKWGFPSMDQYIIAGNLVFNLKKIRDDNLIIKIDDEIKKGYPQQDQDVLNYCCYNHISFLKLKYGLFSRWIYTKDLYNFKNRIFDVADIDEALKSLSIVHFAGGIVKPWINIRASYASEWWEYAKALLPEDEYWYWYSKAEKMTEERDWKNILSKIRKCIKGEVYIWGCAWVGQLLASWFKNNGIEVDGFIDNNPDLQGLTVEGIKVYSITKICTKSDTTIVISSQRAYDEIFRQCVLYGVEKDNIIIYRHDKNDLYLQSLMPEYREFEYCDLMAKEIGECAYNMTTEELRKIDAHGIWKKIWR